MSVSTQSKARDALLELLGVAAITAVAAWLRFHALDIAPPSLYHDESIYGVLGAYVYHGNRDIYFGEREGLYMYLLAAGMRLLGHDVLTLRIVSATLGTATIPALYLLARLMFGRQVAILAASGLAASYWHVSLSRTVFRAMTLPLFETVAFAALWGALRMRAPLARFPLVAVAGAALGLTLYTYIAARLVPAVVLVFALSEVLLRRAGRAAWLGAPVYAASAGLVFWPLGVFMLEKPAMFLGRMEEVAVGAAGSGLALYVDNLGKVAGMFFLAGDQNWRHNLAGKPVFDPAFAVAFLLGLGLCLHRWRAPECRFLLIWAPAMLVPTLAAVDAPHFLRADGVLPALYLLSALGFSWLFERAAAAFPWVAARRPGTFLAFTALLLLAPAVSTARTYFDDWLRRPETYYAFDGPHGSAADYLARSETWRTAAAGKGDFFLSRYFWQDRTAMMYRLWPWIAGRDRDDMGATRLGSRWWDESRSLPLRAEGARYLLRDGSSWAASELRRLYGASLGEEVGATYLPGIVPFVVFEAPPGGLRLPAQSLATFGGTLALDATRETVPTASGSEVEVVTQWRVAQVPPEWKRAERGPSVFVHVLDHDGSLLAAADGLGFEPVDWREGEGFLLRHTLPLPAGLAPGDYRVLVGVTGPDGRRLDVAGSHDGAFQLPQSLAVMPNRGTVPPALEQTASASFDGRLTLLGANLGRVAEVTPGESLRLDLYWRALSDIGVDYAAEIALVSPDGVTEASARGAPAFGTYPTSRWTTGEIVRDPRALTVGPRARAGEYEIRVQVAGPDGVRHAPVSLGTVRVRTVPRAFAPPETMTALPAQANFGNLAGLLGYMAEPPAPAPGGPLKVTLFWRCLAETDERFKVFVHLVGGKGLVAQSDAEPAGNARPLSGWVEGEVVADMHEISLPSQLAPGEYDVLVGLYSSQDGRRLKLTGLPGGGDSVRLLRVSLGH